MRSSQRFAVGVHVLTLLARARPDPVTSDAMAGSVNTNPVVIRRVCGALRRAGLVASQPGAGGGWTLRRPPEAITLAEVLRAVGEASPFALPGSQANPDCPVGAHIQGTLARVFDDAAGAMERQLAGVTVGDVLRSVLAGNRAGGWQRAGPRRAPDPLP